MRVPKTSKVRKDAWTRQNGEVFNRKVQRDQTGTADGFSTTKGTEDTEGDTDPNAKTTERL